MLRGKGRWLTKRDETTPLLNDNKSQSYGQNDVEVTPMHHGGYTLNVSQAWTGLTVGLIEMNED